MPLFDRKDKSRYATFTRRTLMLSGAMGSILAVLGGRFYQLQILNGDEYLVKAKDNSISRRFVFPPRGRILDRFGTELATNRRNYRVVIVPEQASQGVETALDSVSKIIQLDPSQKARVLHEIAQNKKFAQIPIAENLSWEEFARINMHLPYLPGVQPDVGETRAYPYGDELSHLLGYVAAANVKDIQEDNDPLLAQPGFRVGKRGTRKVAEDALEDPEVVRLCDELPPGFWADREAADAPFARHHDHDDERHDRVVQHRVGVERLPPLLDVGLVLLELGAAALDPGASGHCRLPSTSA